MNVSLENFGATVKPIDLALYAGVALVIYVLFQEKINNIFTQIKNQLKNIKRPDLPSLDTNLFPDIEPTTQDDIFFELIKSWKQTRDLAEEYGASKAVQIADEMFPHLVPKDETNEE